MKNIIKVVMNLDRAYLCLTTIKGVDKMQSRIWSL